MGSRLEGYEVCEAVAPPHDCSCSRSVCVVLRSSCFQKHLYVPYPKYGTLHMLWKETLDSLLKPRGAMLDDEFDVSSLAHVSIGPPTE